MQTEDILLGRLIALAEFKFLLKVVLCPDLDVCSRLHFGENKIELRPTDPKLAVLALLTEIARNSVKTFHAGAGFSPLVEAAMIIQTGATLADAWSINIENFDRVWREYHSDLIEYDFRSKHEQ